MDLWAEIKEDQERGTRRLVAECGDRLFTAAFLLCRDEALAEDLVFRTLARAVRRIGQYRECAPFYNWLYSILLNLYRSDLRKRKAEPFATGVIPEEASVSTWVGADGETLNADEAAAVRQAVHALPPIFREAVVLRYFEDKSLAEMAELLAVPLGTVKSRLRLAYGRLSGMLGGFFDKKKLEIHRNELPRM